MVLTFLPMITFDTLLLPLNAFALTAVTVNVMPLYFMPAGTVMVFAFFFVPVTPAKEAVPVFLLLFCPVILYL